MEHFAGGLRDRWHHPRLRDVPLHTVAGLFETRRVLSPRAKSAGFLSVKYTRGRQELFDMATIIRSGEFHEDDIVEIDASDEFERCHFYGCEFTGKFMLARDCIFHDCPAVPMGNGSLFVGCSFTDCFLRCDPE